MNSAVYIARQPILTTSGDVFGYELLYRDSWHAQRCVAPDGDRAAAQVLTDALLSFGLDRVSERQPVFLNLTKPLILSDMLALIEPRAAVLEIREDVTLDDDVLKACERLHAQGYALALDDFIEGSDAEALLPFSRYVKVDVLQTSPTQASAIAQRLLKMGVQLVAEKVESRDLYDKTQRDGYGLFQGYYFCRPKTLTTRTIPAPQLAYLRLISALRRPDLSMAELEALVKQDTSLSLRVLRLVNSAAFALHLPHVFRSAALGRVGTAP